MSVSYVNRIAKALEEIAGIDNSNGSNLKDTQRIYRALETKAGMPPELCDGKPWRKDTERIADAVEYMAEHPTPTPSGTLDIDANGTYDIRGYAYVNVNVL